MSDVADYLSNYGTDITSRYNTTKTNGATTEDYLTDTREESTRKAKNTLDFEDMLLLMVAQLQNQTIDNTADTNDMMNQLIQMTVMQALTDMTSQVEELTLANVMGYSASLVGQYVTVGVPTKDGKGIEELYGQVEASGTYDGQQVIFINGESYLLSSIMAVGKLPPLKDPDAPDENPDGADGDGTEGGNGVQGPDGGTEGGGSGSATEGVQNSGAAGESGNNGTESNADGGTEAAGENTISGTQGI